MSSSPAGRFFQGTHDESLKKSALSVEQIAREIVQKGADALAASGRLPDGTLIDATDITRAAQLLADLLRAHFGGKS